MVEKAPQAFFLPPSWGSPPTLRLPFGVVELETPLLSEEELQSLLAHLRHAGERLRRWKVGEVIEALGEAAARWQKGEDIRRQMAERWLPQITGYSPPVVRFAIEQVLALLSPEALWRKVQAEFPDPGVLDGFRPIPGGGRTRAMGARLVVDFVAGNIPGLAVQEMTHALLVKAPILVKLPRNEPLWAPLFASTLAEVAPPLGESIALLWWPREEGNFHRLAAEAAEVVVASGSDETLSALRRYVPPTTLFLPHGHRVSCAFVHRACLTRETAEALAYDVAHYDQQGCLSPHAVYLQSNDDPSPETFAGWLAEALQRLETTLPKGKTFPQEAAAIQQRRALARLLGAKVLASEGSTAWTVILETKPEHSPEPSRFPFSCLGRTIILRVVEDWRTMLLQLEPLAPHLSAMGVALPPEEVEAFREALAEVGITRFCPIGLLQTPPPTWHQDGRSPLSDLVRWVDWEENE